MDICLNKYLFNMIPLDYPRSPLMLVQPDTFQEKAEYLPTEKSLSDQG
jgi:hypothetical protein